MQLDMQAELHAQRRTIEQLATELREELKQSAAASAAAAAVQVQVPKPPPEPVLITCIDDECPRGPIPAFIMTKSATGPLAPSNTA